jgi:hypothetical protein
MTSDEMREQLINSSTTAIHSINWRADHVNVNLIAAEANHDVDPVDIGNILYGDEVHTKGTKGTWQHLRKANGLMEEEEFQAKLSAYILLKNAGGEVITEYGKYMFMARKNQLVKFCHYFSLDKVYDSKSWIE